MLIRQKLVGTGKEGDTFRVSLPTYAIVFIDYTGKVAIVDVPDTSYPPHEASCGCVVQEVTVASSATAEISGVVPIDGQPAQKTFTGVTVQHDAAHIATAATFYDMLYREHRGEFRLQDA